MKIKTQFPQLDMVTAQTHLTSIIIVDDDEDDRDLLTSAFEQLAPNVKIVQFNNGVDLMAYLIDFSTELPDIIFLDLNMPLMNGEECLSDIRIEPKFNNIPVIIYSGYYDSLKMETLKMKGANHCLRKPNTFSGLKKLIGECLNSYSQKMKIFSDFSIT